MPSNAAGGVQGAARGGRSLGATSFANLLILGLMNFPLLRALALPLSSSSYGTREHDAPDGKSPEDPTLWIYLSVAFALVVLGGIFAGLTIAYAS